MKPTEKRVTLCPLPNFILWWNQSITKLQVNLKWPNTYIIGVPANGGGRKERGKKNIFEETMAEEFPFLMKSNTQRSKKLNEPQA